METIAVANLVLLLGAVLVLVGILSSLAARRFGAPLLLVFMLIGMLAGEEGIGGITFNDYRVTFIVGSLALAIILFDGGLRTRLSTFQGALAPSLLLATVGVVATAGLVGLFAAQVLGLGWLEGLLLGSIIASTDAAAVFFLLRAGKIRLRRRLGSTLEIESGTNDPVAVFLTVVLTELLVASLAGEGEAVLSMTVLAMLGQQAVIGAAIGVAGGFAVTTILNRVDLPEGLHSLFVAASAIITFALGATLGGSGFLAVYLAGLVVGNRPVRAFPSIVSFHETVTWLSQIVMFLVLGLLVTPSRILEYALPALAVALFLILVARPVAVWLCLTPFQFTQRERGFVAWVGLRGAVSIFLAAIPTLAGVPNAEVYFNVAFVVVLVSLLAQGWTIRTIAIRLGLAVPDTVRSVHRVELDLPGQLDQEMVGYPVLADSPILAHGMVPVWARAVLVVRDRRIMEPSEAGKLQEGDYAYFIVPLKAVGRFDRLFAPAGERPESPPPELAEFDIDGSARVADLARLYGLRLEQDEVEGTVADLFARAVDSDEEAEVRIGDRLRLGSIELVVRSLEAGRVRRAVMLIARAGRDDALGTSVAFVRNLGPSLGRHMRTTFSRRLRRERRTGVDAARTDSQAAVDKGRATDP